MHRFVFRSWRVYRLAVAAYQEVEQVMAQLPRNSAHLGWQSFRSASSIVLNLAEGAGEFRPLEKARFYRMAQRSAWETAGNLFMAVDTGKLEEGQVVAAVDLLDEIAAMLTAMQKHAEARAMARDRASRPRRRRRHRRLD